MTEPHQSSADGNQLLAAHTSQLSLQPIYIPIAI
jgi:hypothetical protein